MFGFDRRRKDPVAEFWDWFTTNGAAIERDARAVSNATPASKLIVQDLGMRLARVSPDVVHEIGISPEDLVELIISADGLAAAFPAVSALVGAAPQLRNFKFTAFRPREGPVQLNIYGKQVGFEHARYRANPEGDRFGLDVFIDVEGTAHEIGTIGFLLLDAALGEYDVGTGIGSIEFHAGAPEDAKPLDELASEFDAFRAATVH
jgi:hypothetical protein